jgi:hypothetical protein
MRSVLHALAFIAIFIGWSQAEGAEMSPLSVGVADHAFDHLGAIGDQAQAAAGSGATIIYCTGFGQVGYQGLTKPDALKATHDAVSAYIRGAKANGIRLAIGYVCATSIVKLNEFDRNWTPEFRSHFSSPPSDWLQQDRNGKPLPSWYGGDYSPACMNNPDWRTYEKYIVRLQLESGHDGIFFDNPTVHPQGCYCDHCMKKFARFLMAEGGKPDLADAPVSTLRQMAVDRPKDFLRFRTTIAADFLADIRAYAQTIKPGALITCNNSLNAPEAFFSQCRTYAYDIDELSKVEDLVVVEDMASQPRVLPDGKVVEYGPVYQLLRAISHGKPVVAVALADADYHTPPNLMRLAMSEAAAHGASYLSWPTWPQEQRTRMAAAVRPEAEFLRVNAGLLNHTHPRADVLLFLPFQRWQETTECRALQLSRDLDEANVQFTVASEDDLAKALAAKPRPVVVIESPSVLTPIESNLLETYKAAGGKVVAAQGDHWLATLRSAAHRSVEIVHAPPTLRAVMSDQRNKTIVHLLNLNIQRQSSFQDRVNPATAVRLRIRVPFAPVHSATALSADPEATHERCSFTTTAENGDTVVEIAVPRVDISTVLVIE